MNKQMLILRGDKKESYAAFREELLQLGRKLLEEPDIGSLKITLTLAAPPRISVIPFRREKIGVISCTGADAALSIVREQVKKARALAGAYTVEEALPVAYTKAWKDGEATPGVCLLTLFHQRPGIDRETFIRRWHEGHTPLSLRLHPLWNYNRNVVRESLTEDQPWYDGIVEEQFRSRKELLNPFVFFGPPLKVVHHMLEVWKDTRSFIHMKRIETYLATEFVLRSPQN
jgi:hypothetical protein